MISTEEVGQSGTLAMVLVRRCNSVQVDHKTRSYPDRSLNWSTGWVVKQDADEAT